MVRAVEKGLLNTPWVLETLKTVLARSEQSSGVVPGGPTGTTAWNDIEAGLFLLLGVLASGSAVTYRKDVLVTRLLDGLAGVSSASSATSSAGPWSLPDPRLNAWADPQQYEHPIVPRLMIRRACALLQQVDAQVVAREDLLRGSLRALVTQFFPALQGLAGAGRSSQHAQGGGPPGRKSSPWATPERAADDPELELHAELQCVKALDSLVQASVAVRETNGSFFELSGTPGGGERFLWQELMQSALEQLIPSASLQTDTREGVLLIVGAVLVAMATQRVSV